MLNINVVMILPVFCGSEASIHVRSPGCPGFTSHRACRIDSSTSPYQFSVQYFNNKPDEQVARKRGKPLSPIVHPATSTGTGSCSCPIYLRVRLISFDTTNIIVTQPGDQDIDQNGTCVRSPACVHIICIYACVGPIGPTIYVCSFASTLNNINSFVGPIPFALTLCHRKSMWKRTAKQFCVM